MTTMDPADLPPGGSHLPGPPPVVPPQPRGSWLLGVCLLAAAVMVLATMIRQGFAHPMLDALGGLLLFEAVAAALPDARRPVGELLLGSAVILLVLPIAWRVALTQVLELVAGAALLATAGAIQLEYHPVDVTPDGQAHWRTVMMPRLLLGAMSRWPRRPHP